MEVGDRGISVRAIWLRFSHRYLKIPTLRFRRSIQSSLVDLEQGHRPSSILMRLSEKRIQNASISGLVHEHKGLLFVACVFFAFMQAGLFTGHANHESTEAYPDVKTSGWITEATFNTPFAKSTQQSLTEHPIPKLMSNAENRFRSLLSKQSRTLKAAVKEYKTRYRRDPPKGFDDWWKFAQENDVKLVDEFDGLVDDMAPFWELSGLEVRRRAIQVSVRAAFMTFASC